MQRSAWSARDRAFARVLGAYGSLGQWKRRVLATRARSHRAGRWTHAVIGAVARAGACVLVALPALGPASCGDEPQGGAPPEVPFVPEDADACVPLLERPDDLAAPGPWPVGTRRVSVARAGGGQLEVDVFYPAVRGSEVNAPAARFDIRAFLPPSQRDVVPDARAPIQACECARDLPVDDDRGPYPAVVFVHGTASFSTQSLADVTHWASRGFVVVAATHPGLSLADQLSLFCPDDPSGSRDVVADVGALVAALRAAPAGALAFLSAPPSIALVGHSAGANAVVLAASTLEAEGASDVKVVVSLSGNARHDGAATFLALAGTGDRVVRAAASEEAFSGSSLPRRYVALDNAGHLAFSDLCDTRNDDGENLLVIAEDEGVCGAQLAGLLFDCSPELQAAPLSRAIVQTATTWVLEDTLHCAPPSRTFADSLAALDGVAAVREDLGP